MANLDAHFIECHNLENDLDNNESNNPQRHFCYMKSCKGECEFNPSLDKIQDDPPVQNKSVQETNKKVNTPDSTPKRSTKRVKAGAINKRSTRKRVVNETKKVVNARKKLKLESKKEDGVKGFFSDDGSHDDSGNEDVDDEDEVSKDEEPDVFDLKFIDQEEDEVDFVQKDAEFVPPFFEPEASDTEEEGGRGGAEEGEEDDEETAQIKMDEAEVIEEGKQNDYLYGTTARWKVEDGPYVGGKFKSPGNKSILQEKTYYHVNEAVSKCPDFGYYLESVNVEDLFGNSSLLRSNYETAISLIHTFRKTFVEWYHQTGKNVKSSHSNTKTGPTGKKMLGFFHYTIAALTLRVLCGNKKRMYELFHDMSESYQAMNVIDMYLYQRVAFSIYDNLCNFAEHTHIFPYSEDSEEMTKEEIEEIKVS